MFTSLIDYFQRLTAYVYVVLRHSASNVQRPVWGDLDTRS